MRERGLKSYFKSIAGRIFASRSREGAWIEMKPLTALARPHTGRSREGAWIEMPAWHNTLQSKGVAPVRERGLKCNAINI